MVKMNQKVSMSLGGRRVDAREGRKEIARIVNDFRREGERRRSSVLVFSATEQTANTYQTE